MDIPKKFNTQGRISEPRTTRKPPIIVMTNPMFTLEADPDGTGLPPIMPGLAPLSLVPQLEQKIALSPLSTLH